MADTPVPPLYRPAAYQAADAVKIVHDHPFALLMSPQMHATFTPIVFEFDDRSDVMVGHMAGRNAHAMSLQTGDQALAVFAGPHAYISPRWYVEKPSVPTWNYVSAHVRGTLEVVTDDAAQLAILRRSIDLMEAGFDTPWSIDDAPEGKVDQLLPLIRSFRLHVETIEGVTKLSQTHPSGDRARIISGLKADPSSDLADHMINIENEKPSVILNSKL
ncbi:FMN-binding negative transcriptional regulator [Asticcacaulis machinosus]|uniref:FMN-binding negative transcriptional regulator n=1 Tax=Asticcacaulis machinosus TaxID=2984211 RepID=A0ABT5HNF5_9CAUL|nr:FMN-binding negative transcriptional regulator [Asticcacaulis machinosus]MDC7677779.1 FMN-binding negative transcriptional regulator [Asticcacaulis machinosus]